MRTDGRSHLALRCGITLAAALTAPLLLVGGFAYDRLVHRLYRGEGPGPYSKEEGWVRPEYFVVTNALVRALTWPTRRDGMLRRRPARTTGHGTGSDHSDA
ncbi:hypothetical protein [Streptomyces sp. NPDC096068]|uniref:hypothetical protein n=1 Tax=Streptomyces sp. NPDC096068 TaxID=3155424 RepID=UPI0033226EFD